MVVAGVHLVRLCDHVVEELVVLVDLEEAQIGNFLDALEVEVTLYHLRLRDEELENDEEAYD